MDPNEILNPTDPQPTETPTPAAPAEPAGEPSVVDAIAAAVGTEPKPDDSAAAVEETPKPDEPAEPSAEEKAKAEEARLDAEAKALGLTKPDTTAKFKELSRAAARAKELEPLEQEVVTLRETLGQQQAVFDHLERNGITGEQFGEMVMIASFANSGDPVRMERAHEALLKAAADIGQRLGLETPGFDPLQAHPDLLAAVQNMDMDRKHALEVAQARKLREATTHYSAQQGQAQIAQQEQQRVTQELATLEQTLRATDPKFEAKWALLKPTLLPILHRLPLSERANAFQQAYAAFQLPAAPVAPAQKRPDPANPGRPAMAAGAKTPTNTAEAIMLGLGLG